jgi:predicted esterase
VLLVGLLVTVLTVPTAIGAAGKLEPLEVSGFHPAIHIRPWAGEEGVPRPVVVVLHGNFDRPEWECDAWDRIVAGRAWLLCPRGKPRADAPGLDRWTYSSAKGMSAEIDAGLHALRGRYGAAIADDAPIYAGFSLGAILGNRLLTAEPGRFPRAFLVEGGAGFWNAARARAFVSGGGVAVYFGCGGAGCARSAAAAAKALNGAGARSEVITVKGLGHNYGPPFPGRAKPTFDRLVADAPGW